MDFIWFVHPCCFLILINPTAFSLTYAWQATATTTTSVSFICGTITIQHCKSVAITAWQLLRGRHILFDILLCFNLILCEHKVNFIFVFRFSSFYFNTYLKVNWSLHILMNSKWITQKMHETWTYVYSYLLNKASSF